MKIFTIRLVLLALAMFIGTVLVEYVASLNAPLALWGGLFYLTMLTWFIHWLVFESSKGNQKTMIQKVMLGSMLRMILAVLYLAITLYNVKPVNVFLVISYCAYFAVFLVFEISIIRTNLRPDSKPLQKNENA